MQRIQRHRGWRPNSSADTTSGSADLSLRDETTVHRPKRELTVVAHEEAPPPVVRDGAEPIDLDRGAFRRSACWVIERWAAWLLR